MICPLAFAVGRSTACSEAHCPWYRVPGTIRACAVEQWAPQAARDTRVARWFATRGEAIVAGRSALLR